jgi:hypothetical protein
MKAEHSRVSAWNVTSKLHSNDARNPLSKVHLRTFSRPSQYPQHPQIFCAAQIFVVNSPHRAKNESPGAGMVRRISAGQGKSMRKLDLPHISPVIAFGQTAILTATATELRPTPPLRGHWKMLPPPAVP